MGMVSVSDHITLVILADDMICMESMVVLMGLFTFMMMIMIGFINRIRRKERVAVPFVVDELKDLSVVNATALLNLLARNNITMISAFPDVDPDLAPLFTKNYKILPGRTLATVKLEAEEDVHA